MASSGLPPPPEAAQLTGPWLRSAEGKALLAAYLAAVYAQQTMQYVVIKNGVRQPPVAIKTDGKSAIVEITV